MLSTTVPKVHIRILRHVTHGIFCVGDKGQKLYWDPTGGEGGRNLPFSSGPQVKHSIVNLILDVLNEEGSPTTFMHVPETGDKMKQDTSFTAADPRYTEDLVRGMLRMPDDREPLPKGKKHSTALKRRSPMSISYMVAVHPLLASFCDTTGTVDRRGRKNVTIAVRDAGKTRRAWSEKEIEKYIADTGNDLPPTKFIKSTVTATGLFVEDIEINVHRLFSVELNRKEPEIEDSTAEGLRALGWVEIERYGRRYLTVPPEKRAKLAYAVAYGLLNWKTDTNQARAYSPEVVHAVAIAENNAGAPPMAIYGKLLEDAENGKRRASAQVRYRTDVGAQLFITIHAEHDAVVDGDPQAIEKAVEVLAQLFLKFE